MTGMREDLERRRHHQQPRPHTRHWHGNTSVAGTVEDCPDCTPQREES